jgi:putative peptide zinc metalloprotease protein
MMRLAARALLTIGLTTAVLVTPTTAYAAPDVRADDNVSVAVNDKDGSSVFKLAFSIARVSGDVVDSSNVAVAYASCTDCQTVAIAIQVVLVTGDPSVVTPENVAIAINDACNLCDTLASAYQIVLGNGARVRFTDEGQRRIAAIRKRLHDLKKSDLTIEQIQAEVAAAVADLKQVLTTELVVVERSSPSESQPSPGDTTASAAPTPGEVITETAVPASPEATSAASESPTPADSPTAEATSTSTP